MNQDEKFMRLALKEADKAEAIDEVPIGAIIVKNDKVIARAYNKKECSNNPLGHAELIAISKACKKLNAWRLINCDMYITLEHCIMCAGAIIQSRFKRVVFGAYDPKGGAFGSSTNILEAKNINHHPEVVSEVLLEECSNKLKNYFKKKR